MSNLPRTRWDHISDKDAPTFKNSEAEVTDHCQCCGIYANAVDLPDSKWLDKGDPLIRIEVEMRLGPDAHRLGSLLLCPWCASALRQYFVDPFIEKYHQPLQEKLDKIEAALKGL